MTNYLGNTYLTRSFRHDALPLADEEQRLARVFMACLLWDVYHHTILLYRLPIAVRTIAGQLRMSPCKVTMSNIITHTWLTFSGVYETFFIQLFYIL